MLRKELTFYLIFLLTCKLFADATRASQSHIHSINRRGPYIGVLVPTTYELAPIMLKGRFVADPHTPYLDTGGKRFHVGSIHNRKVVISLTGLGMLNAGTTTQQLVDHFDVTSVLLYGIAGSLNSSLNIADVSIASSWVHTGLWYWQRFEQGPQNPLSLESNGDYTRELGHIHFGDYNIPFISKENSDRLSNIYFQREEVYSVNGIPEVRQHKFFVPVSKHLYSLAKKLKGLKLRSCLNSTACLSYKPEVVLGLKGASANIFVDNAAYRDFLFKMFNVSTVDMESAAVALRCIAQGVPYIIIRSASDLAGGSNRSNEASEFASLAAENAVITTIELINML